MKLIQLDCPQCGAKLEVDSDRQFVFCQYCGNKILIDDEITRSEVVHIYRDEAKIRELELQEQARLREEEKIKELKRQQLAWEEGKKAAWTRYWLIIAGVFIVNLILCILLKSSTFFGFAYILSIFIPIFFPYKYYDRPKWKIWVPWTIGLMIFFGILSGFAP